MLINLYFKASAVEPMHDFAVLLIVLYLVHEHASGLECGNLVLGNDDGGVFRNISCCLLATGLHNEAAETTEIHIFAARERLFYDFHEVLDSSEYSGFFNTGGLRNFVDDVGFSHFLC